MRSISACSVFVMTQHELRRASTHAAEQSEGMASTNRQAAWASDPRWARAKEHAMRGEVLHAEMLLRSLLAEHPDYTPARLVVADYMVERGDRDGALQWLRTPQADDFGGKLQ